MTDGRTFFIPSGTRGDDRRTHIMRINDWPGSDASGEGTAIWHPEASQDPRLNASGVLEEEHGDPTAEDHAPVPEAHQDPDQPDPPAQDDSKDGSATSY